MNENEQSAVAFARTFYENCGPEWEPRDLKAIVRKEHGVNLSTEIIVKIMKGHQLKRRKCESLEQVNPPIQSNPRSNLFVIPRDATPNDFKAIVMTWSKYCAVQPKDYDPVEYVIPFPKEKGLLFIPLLPHIPFESDPSQSPLPVPRIINKMKH